MAATDGWESATLADEVDLLTGFPFRSHEYTESSDGIRLLRGDNVGQRILRWDGVKRWSDSGLDEYREYLLEPGDVVLAMDRPWIEAGLKFAILNDRDVPSLLVQRVARLRGRASLDTRFLGYLIGSPQFAQHVLSVQTGTAVPHISGSQILDFQFLKPPPEEQDAIASVLSALDDKIELNRRMNETLEAIARAIFKSWFVDFDPVRARMEGRPPILPAELVDQFPNQLVESPIGPVPEGWGVAPLGEHVEVVRGLSYRGADLADEGIPLHNLNSVLEGGGYKYDGIKYYAGEYKERHLVEPGDVIVANTEQGHQYLLIGYPAIVPAIHGNEGLFSHHLYRVRPRAQSPVIRRYLYLLFLSSRLRQEITAYTHGTTVNMLSIEGLRRPRFVVPPGKLIEAFDQLVRPMFELAEGLVAESRTLAETRDWLLPRLVSGRIRLSPDSVLPAKRENAG